MKAIAIDDEPPALRIITHFCSKGEGVELLKTFTSTVEASRFLQENPVDLLFLDINMPAISGIDFYRSLPEKCMVIFTTAYAEYAVEGFNLQAVDYLLKPFTFERFQQAVTKAREYHRFLNQSEPSRYIYIRADYSVYKIDVADIMFVEGLDDYLKIHLHQSKPIVARLTMKSLMQQLPAEDFIRVHRSFIVPFSRIESVRNKIIQLADEEIPIGASYEADFQKRFRN